MAKKREEVVEKKSLYPSQYGSHKSMINEEKTQKLKDKNLVVCTDDLGDYTTERIKLDNGLADVNRYEMKRMSKLVTITKKEKKNNR